MFVAGNARVSGAPGDVWVPQIILTPPRAPSPDDEGHDMVDEDDDFEDEDNALIDDRTVMDTEDDAIENNTPEDGGAE